MTRRITLFLALVLPILLLWTFAQAADEVKIESFTPSAGWAGSSAKPESGTLVQIVGKHFDSGVERNEVTFTDSSGAQSVKAQVLLSRPDGSAYHYETAFGSRGSALGELDHIADIAIDEQSGNIYVANVGNHRIEVFDRDGKPLRQLGVGLILNPRGLAVDKQGNVYVAGSFVSPHGEGVGVFVGGLNSPVKFIGADGTLKGPQSIDVDDRGYIYVIDLYVEGSGVPLGYPKVVLFDSLGEKQFSFWEESWQVNLKISVDPRGDTSTSDRTFYVSDRYNKALYKYDTRQPLIARWEFPGAEYVGWVDVDWEGFVYVDLGSAGLAKLDSSGNFVETLIAPLSFSYPAFRTVNRDRRVYIADTLDSDSSSCECIKVYALPNSDGLWVRVPYGAKTGPISVITRDIWGAPYSDTSVADFTVFETNSAITVSRVEPTQGVWSYPFVTGKDTLVWAELNGMFGSPGRDKSTIRITTPSSGSLEREVDHYEYEFDENTNGHHKTFAHFHIPNSLVSKVGQYIFEVQFKRDGINLSSGPPKNVEFFETNGIRLLFVKYTGIPNDQWGTENPFPWFDMRTFLYGIETFKRTFPVHPEKVSFHFATGQYKDYISDGVAFAELGKITGDLVDIANKYKEQPSWFQPDRAVALVDDGLNKTGADSPDNNYYFGISGGIYKNLCFFWKTPLGQVYDWGSLLLHELGHSYGLVWKGANVNPENHQHSKNISLTQELGAPITAWSSIADKLWAGDMVRSIMFGTPADDIAFFESKAQQPQDEKLDYHRIFDQIKSLSASSSSRVFSTFASSSMLGSQKFVIRGRIESDDKVFVDGSYLTASDIALTPVTESDYSLVFEDEAGRILSADGFLLSFPAYSGSVSSNKYGFFDLIRPYPGATAKVTIRRKDEIIKTLIPSKNPPVVTAVTVKTSDLGPVKITWGAFDPDYNLLTFSVYFSSDGGLTFIPIANGLSQTKFMWDDALTGGSSSGVVKVVASDGFYQGIALSNTFALPKKKPQAVILIPTEGSRFTEGSAIPIRGTGFDPEDAFLSGAKLRWELDDTIYLGSGGSFTIQNLSKSTPFGPVRLPIAIGVHSIRLVASDIDGNKTSTTVNIEIIPDIDRDGFSDEEERSYGGDPYDPFVRPYRPPVAVCRTVSVTADERCMGAASIDGGSYHPYNDPIILTQTPPGPYQLGSTQVTLTVTGPQDQSSSCQSAVTVIDETPPVIGRVTASPDILWPPNHKMVPIRVRASVKDVCDYSPSCKIISVASNEPQNGLGDGDTAPDWRVTGALNVDLRAERSGNGGGRVYTITVECRDASGNKAISTVDVRVPHDRNSNKGKK